MTTSGSLTYSVPGMTCEHCRAAVQDEVGKVAGVDGVQVDLETKLVAISGTSLDGAAIVDAIDEAGYQVGGSEGTSENPDAEPA